MNFPRHQNHFRRKDLSRDFDRSKERHFYPPERMPGGMQELIDPEHTGSESDYLKSLVDSRAMITVVMRDGERMRGRIRYYDKDCFSLGLSARGPRFLLRKADISYIAEE